MPNIQKEKKLKKFSFENIFISYIILQPIIDTITSICVRNISPKLTLGMFIRSIFMIFLMIYTLVKIDKKSKYQLLVYYGIIAVYCISFILNSYLKYNTTMLFIQVKGLIKTFYFPITFASMLILFKNINFHISSKALYICSILYVLPIVICKYFSIGYVTYQYQESLGSIGLFYAGNEIAAIIALISPICFARFILKEFNPLNYIVCIITVLAMLEIGTKVGFLAISSLLVLSLIICLIRFIKDKKLYKQFVSMLSLVLLTILFIGNTSVGINLNIHLPKSSQTISLPSIDIVTKKPSESYIENVKENPEILLSERNIYFNNTKQNYIKSSLTDKLLGLGYISEENNSIVESKFIEIDYFDIFFYHGIFGTIIYFLPFIYIIITIIKKIIKELKFKIFKYNKIILLLCSLGLGASIALFAGHVFVAPAVSFFIIIVTIELLDTIEQANMEEE